MIPAIEIKMIDFDKFDHEITQFKQDIKTEARRAGLVEMAKPIKATLKQTIPVGRGYDNTGATRKSIGHASVAKRDKAALGLGLDDESLIVGSTRKALDSSGKMRFQQYKLNWLDKGVEEHWIDAGNTHQKRLKIRGKVISGRVYHPGINAMGLLQKAYSAHRGSFEHLWSVGASKALRKYEVKAT